MLVGLQGVGKTTVAAKLARFLQSEKRRPLLVAADVYRPAAVLQLQQLGEQIDAPVHAGAEGEKPAAICAAAAERAAREGFDAIIYDTAGRLAIDEELMAELEEITAASSPANTILVCDALMGRDAVNVAKAFSERLDLDGLVLTKLDGDARGGAALAVKEVTGVPIKFLGTGETLDRLEPFRPEGLASRILGMGDIVGLVRDFEEVADEKEAEEDAARLLKGQFGLDDLLKQLKLIQKMGPLREVFAKMPMFGSFADQADEGELVKVESLIRSMTPGERKTPGDHRQEPRSADRARQRPPLEGRARAGGALRPDARGDGIAGLARRAPLEDPGRGQARGRRRPGRDGPGGAVGGGWGRPRLRAAAGAPASARGRRENASRRGRRGARTAGAEAPRKQPAPRGGGRAPIPRVPASGSVLMLPIRVGSMLQHLSYVIATLCVASAALAADPELLPRPPELEPNVRFWSRIYTEVDSDGRADPRLREPRRRLRGDPPSRRAQHARARSAGGEDQEALPSGAPAPRARKARRT